MSTSASDSSHRTCVRESATRWLARRVARTSAADILAAQASCLPCGVGILPARPACHPSLGVDTRFPPGLPCIARLVCESGGIGRRARFRILCPQGRGGSSPPFRTNSLINHHPSTPAWGWLARCARGDPADSAGGCTPLPSLSGRTSPSLRPPRLQPHTADSRRVRVPPFAPTL